MAIRIPIITDLQDKGIRDAKKAFGDFKSAVGNAEGGMGKFKAGATSVMDTVKANAANFAIAGGAAFAAFALEGIKAFQDLALEAGKFADATGLAVEDASRYLEVAGDLGIPIDQVEGAIGRLNKTIGADPDKVKNLGIDLVYLKDGSLDVNATFLNTIDRLKKIKDPAEKARVAAQLLGKGWQGMAELINLGSDELSTSLAAVSEAKVIDPKKLADARKFRDSMDNLKDSIEELSISLGQNLAPKASEGADGLLKFIDRFKGLWNVADRAWDKLPFGDWILKSLNPLEKINPDNWLRFPDAIGNIGKAIGGFFGFFKDDKDVVPVFIDDMKAARDDAELMNKALVDAKNDALVPFYAAVDHSTEAIVNADTAWKDFTDSLDQEVSLDNAKTQLDELSTAAGLAFGSDNQKLIDDYEQKYAEFSTTLSGIAGEMDNISSKEILFKFKTEGPAAALEYARYLANGAEFGGLTPEQALNLAGITTGSTSGRASGGPVSGNTPYLVGERGPELFVPRGAGDIKSAGSFGGGNNITINVNGGDPNSVVRALQQYVRQSGPVPLNTRAM